MRRIPPREFSFGEQSYLPMEDILLEYKAPELATWIYLASLLIVALFFKFNRLWSLRNLDLLGLIVFAPGLYLVDPSGPRQFVGYAWLFIVSGLFLIRLLLDPLMVRRPLLEPNLSSGGMAFIGVALLLFMTTNVLTKELTEADLAGPRRLRTLLSRTDAPAEQVTLQVYGPGYPLLQLLPNILTRPLVQPRNLDREEISPFLFDAAAARTMAILSNVLIVAGLILIGVWHYDNVRTGIAVATLYLLLPYTAAMTGRVYHCLPAALLTWAIVMYRRPLVAGVLVGLAAGAIYYPLFLLPLWCSFYWQRGLLRFVSGFVATLALTVASLVFTSADMASFLTQMQHMLGWTSLTLAGGQGFWAGSESLAPYRIPVFVAFVALSISFAIWPAQKNLGTLLSCSAALMLGTQFWHAQGGGVYMAWYLPFLLLTVFRPNLEDRIAVSTLGEGWFSARRWTPRVRAA